MAPKAQTWLPAPEQYRVGACYKGQVVHVTHFGVFVELEPGVQGLCEITEMWNWRLGLMPADLTQVGNWREFKVRYISADRMNVRLEMTGH